jgi:hypothetical protein
VENVENMIEFVTNTRSATVTFTNQKHINRIKKLYEEHPDEFKFFEENSDGSVCAKIPLKWVKISPPKKVSEAQRQAASERFRKLREEGKLQTRNS